MANSDCSNSALMVLSVVVMMLKDGCVMRMWRRRTGVSNHWHTDCCSIDGHSTASTSVRMMCRMMRSREH